MKERRIASNSYCLLFRVLFPFLIIIYMHLIIYIPFICTCWAICINWNETKNLIKHWLFENVSFKGSWLGVVFCALKACAVVNKTNIFASLIIQDSNYNYLPCQIWIKCIFPRRYKGGRKLGLAFLSFLSQTFVPKMFDSVHIILPLDLHH